MPEEHTNRRLAAILAADVVGYSRMMGADEAGTLAALKRHRETVFDPAVAEHNGRVVKLIGDGTLVEFASVVDAVKCALVIQRAIRTEMRAQSNGRNITLRIGVNLGDVIIDGDDIYGDGVNVAARLESIADPGGICVASIVNESVGSRIDEAFTDGGEVTVKNIDRPIHVWKWRPDSDPAAEALPQQAGGPAETRGERASVAVLPFDNMSGDPEQEYFSDGITEDIITDLSKISGLTVIARNSSFVYKGKSVDIRTVARDLGVNSVLEGSIRRAGNRVRITAQLIDATSGAHLWAERYDRDMTDIFEVQDDVTRQIVDALKVKLTKAESARLADTPTRSVEAHDLFLRARELLLGAKKDRAVFEQIAGLLNAAIALDPDYAEPYAGLSMAHCLDFQNRWTDAPDSMDLAERFAKIATTKGPNQAYTHYVAAVITFWKGDLAKSIEESEIALANGPNYALALGTRGLATIYSGAPLDAIPYFERAIQLDPAFKQQFTHFLGSAYLVAGRYEAAASSFRERIRLVPETDLSRGLLVATLGHLGEIKEARRILVELKRISPKYSFADHIARLPFTNPADANRIREGFAKAGPLG